MVQDEFVGDEYQGDEWQQGGGFQDQYWDQYEGFRRKKLRCSFSEIIVYAMLKPQYFDYISYLNNYLMIKVIENSYWYFKFV